jgi:serine/threonine protein kinase
LAGLEGTTLGPYQVISLLGKGGMGQVYRAHDPRLGREVAIKVLSAALAQEHGYLERFRREARAIAQLNHPNIVSVYDFGEQGSTTYLVMPLIQGGTLRDYLAQRGMLPLNEAVALIEQVGSALQYAHERGLIHRDVKPANILVGPDGRALLSDFGIVRVVQGEDTGATLTHTGAFVGSPEYAAPEMVLAQGIDRRVDIYALGMMLFQLLTGRTAFTATTPVQLLMMQAQAQPPSPRSFNPAIPPAVEAVILKALAKSPDQRYSSAAELVAALRAAVGFQPAGATTGPTAGGDLSNMVTMMSTTPPPAPIGAVPFAPVGAAPVPPIGATPVPPIGATPVPPIGPPLTPGTGYTMQPSAWASTPSEPPTIPPTFSTGLNRPYEQTLPNEQPRIPGGAAPTPPAGQGNKSRLSVVVLVALAAALILGGGGALAFGVSQGWFGSKVASTPSPVVQASPSATATIAPTPTATPLPTYFYMGHNFQVLTGDLENGDTADNMVNFNSSGYVTHEGPNGDLYRFGDALRYGSQYSGATVVHNRNGTFIFVVLVDRFDTYQHAHQYYLRDLTLLEKENPVTLEEEASGGFVMVPGGNKESYQLFVHDRNIVLTLAAVPASNAQDYSAYFLAVAMAAQARGHRCHYVITDPNNPGGSLKPAPDTPSNCS